MVFANMVSNHELNTTCIQCQFSFRGPLPNVFKFELNVVYKVILVFKYILRLRNKSKYKKKGIMGHTPQSHSKWTNYQVCRTTDIYIQCIFCIIGLVPDNIANMSSGVC